MLNNPLERALRLLVPPLDSVSQLKNTCSLLSNLKSDISYKPAVFDGVGKLLIFMGVFFCGFSINSRKNVLKIMDSLCHMLLHHGNETGL